MGENPSWFTVKGADHPVENVFWEDVQVFVQKLNALKNTTQYSLPTEAEWEYACRAGSSSSYCFGSAEGRLGDYAWYYDNSGGKTHPVGQKQPNAWGLYDVDVNAGAVLEGRSLEDVGSDIYKLVGRVADGERTKAELNQQAGILCVYTQHTSL